MKLHFESNTVPDRRDQAVCGISTVAGRLCRSVFLITQALERAGSQQTSGKHFTESGGIGNALQLVVDELSDNLQQCNCATTAALGRLEGKTGAELYRRNETRTSRPTLSRAPCSAQPAPGFLKFRGGGSASVAIQGRQ